MAAHPSLSKSKYVAGRQCAKRLWLTCHKPDLRTPPDEALQAIFDMGSEIGRAAWQLFPGGELVDQEPWEHAEAIDRTRELMADESVPAIFEAAFEYEGVRVRVDVLERLPDDEWGIREVKSSTKLKDVHFEDLAIQWFVLQGCGLRIRSAELVHVDREYVRGEGEIDWNAFFVRAEPAMQVEEALAGVGPRVEDMHRVISRTSAPQIEPSRHCKKPVACEFWKHCTEAKPKDWVFYLPRLDDDHLVELREAGIERIPDIPADFRLTPTQHTMWDAHRRGQPSISSELASALDGAGPPAFYFDVETMNPGIPLYPGTRPYEAIPFQWSLHRVDSDGKLSHHEFLADGHADPRREFAESLLTALRGRAEPVLVYSSYEKRVLTDLAELLPDLADELDTLKDRLVDLLRIIRDHIYHPDFRCKYSLKSVAPALVADFSYGNLAGIADGASASSAFAKIAAGGMEPTAEREVREQLLAYCKCDTSALVELHRSLLELEDRA